MNTLRILAAAALVVALLIALDHCRSERSFAPGHLPPCVLGNDGDIVTLEGRGRVICRGRSWLPFEGPTE